MLVTMMNSQERSGPPEALNQAPSSLGLQGHDVVAKKRAGASEKEDARAEANNESEEHEDKQFDPDDDVALTFPQRVSLCFGKIASLQQLASAGGVLVRTGLADASAFWFDRACHSTRALLNCN